MPLRDQHAGIKGPGLEHGAQAAYLERHVHLRRPRAKRLTIRVQHADQREGQVRRLRRLGIDRWPTHVAGLGEGEVGKVCVMARAPSGLRHMQTQRCV